MATGSGTSTIWATGIEATYGVPVAVTKRHAGVSEGMQRSSTALQSQAITGTLSGFRKAGVISRRAAAGSLNLELSKQGLGRWLQLMAGSSAAPVQQGATTAWLQTHPAGPLDRKVTLQKVIRDLAGTEVETFTNPGTICVGWELTVNVDGIPALNLTLDSEDEETTISSAAALALPVPVHNPFSWNEASLQIDGVPAARVTAMSATGTNSQDVEGYFLGGGGTKSEPTLSDFRTLTGSLTAEFADTSLYDKFVAYSAHSLKLEYVGAIIAATHAERWTLDIPQVRFSGSTPVVGGPGKITVDAPWEAFDNGVNPVFTISYMSTDVAV